MASESSSSSSSVAAAAAAWAPPPDESTLSTAVQSFLNRQSEDELATVSLKTLKQAMEAQFGCNLDAQKPYLKESLNAFVLSEVEKKDISGDRGGVDWNDGDGDDADDDGEDILAGILGDDDDDDVAMCEEDADEPRDSRKGKGRRGGFGAAAQLSTELSEFLGEVVLPRTEVTKRMWAYIKEHNLQVRHLSVWTWWALHLPSTLTPSLVPDGLQDPKNKRTILCDDGLQRVFGRKKVDMFQMTKLLR